jgi:flavin-dependent dehydrogenase
VLVVGGGPAGLATAIRARQAGFDACVIDGSRPPIDKACGEGLMPDGVERLRELGCQPKPERCAPFRGIRYLDREHRAEGRLPAPGGLGIRRLELHAAMARRAEATGVDLRWGVAARGFDGAVQTDGGPVRARWTVAADGLHSPLRRWAGLDGGGARRRRYGLRRHFAIAPWSDCVEVHWAEEAEAYVTPVAPDRVGVAVLWRGGGERFDRLLDRFPALRDRLAGVPVASEDRGAGPLEQRARAVVRGDLALVGDAAGYLDAITGEGLALAFHQAFALVEAIEGGDLSRYAVAHRRLARWPDFMTRSLLRIECRPRLRRRFLRALAADRALFSELLAVHAKAAPPRRLLLTGARLLRRMLLPRG